MTRADWLDYAGFLNSQIKGKDLNSPKNIGEAFNNHMTIQDLSDVKKNKLNVA